MVESTQDLRVELAQATRVLARHNLVGMFGHVSVLTEDPQTYLVCPGAGARKDRCRPSEVIELDLDHDFEPGLPLELYMHSEVHREHPEIRSLVHVHSPALVSLSAMADAPTDLLMMHASFWPEQMPIWEETDLVRSRADAKKLIEILGGEAIALLRWHGAVIVGATLQEAVFRAILAEEHAQQLVTRCHTVGHWPACRAPWIAPISTAACCLRAPTTCTGTTRARSWNWPPEPEGPGSSSARRSICRPVATSTRGLALPV